ncbi:MAG: TonB family protein [Pseudomonadota bacterium]
MTIADLQSALTEMAAYGSAAMLLVLILRRPLRRAFESGAAYLLWALVPLSMVAALLPAATVLPMIVVPHNPIGPAAKGLGLSAPQSAVPMVAWVVLSIWVFGGLSTAFLLVRRQLRFVRSLGHLTACGEMYVAEESVGLPAVIGILRPRIVLPADHAARFDATQQQLVREHEQMHIQRGDQISNLFALVLRCLLWFNPLVYWAVPRFRQDQELACDARVIARNPQGRRAYGEALLRAQLPGLTAPLSCQMGFAHPLKERIAMLKQPVPTSARRMTGFAVVFLLATAAGFAANAAQEAQTGTDSPPKLLFRPAFPSFPATALALHLSGRVEMLVEFNDQGELISVEVQKSDPAGVFDDAALEYARQIRIRPQFKDGIPVAGKLIIPVLFEWKPEQP